MSDIPTTVVVPAVGRTCTSAAAAVEVDWAHQADTYQVHPEPRALADTRRRSAGRPSGNPSEAGRPAVVAVHRGSRRHRSTSRSAGRPWSRGLLAASPVAAAAADRRTAHRPAAAGPCASGALVNLQPTEPDCSLDSADRTPGIKKIH